MAGKLNARRAGGNSRLREGTRGGTGAAWGGRPDAGCGHQEWGAGTVPPVVPLPAAPVSAKVNHMVQFSDRLDRTFGALADPTRRGVLERLGRSDASISDLAERFGMTLTGIKKHVAVLEDAGLVTTEKVGRVRVCRLGPRRLEDETGWIRSYQRMLEERMDRLEDFLERTRGP